MRLIINWISDGNSPISNPAEPNGNQDRLTWRGRVPSVWLFAAEQDENESGCGNYFERNIEHVVVKRYARFFVCHEEDGNVSWLKLGFF